MIFGTNHQQVQLPGTVDAYMSNMIEYINQNFSGVITPLSSCQGSGEGKDGYIELYVRDTHILDTFVKDIFNTFEAFEYTVSYTREGGGRVFTIAWKIPDHNMIEEFHEFIGSKVTKKPIPKYHLSFDFDNDETQPAPGFGDVEHPTLTKNEPNLKARPNLPLGTFMDMNKQMLRGTKYIFTMELNGRTRDVALYYYGHHDQNGVVSLILSSTSPDPMIMVSYYLSTIVMVTFVNDEYPDIIVDQSVHNLSAGTCNIAGNNLINIKRGDCSIGMIKHDGRSQMVPIRVSLFDTVKYILTYNDDAMFEYGTVTHISTNGTMVIGDNEILRDDIIILNNEEGISCEILGGVYLTGEYMTIIDKDNLVVKGILERVVDRGAGYIFSVSESSWVVVEHSGIVSAKRSSMSNEYLDHIVIQGGGVHSTMDRIVSKSHYCTGFDIRLGDVIGVTWDEFPDRYDNGKVVKISIDMMVQLSIDSIRNTLVWVNLIGSNITFDGSGELTRGDTISVTPTDTDGDGTSETYSTTIHTLHSTAGHSFDRNCMLVCDPEDIVGTVHQIRIDSHDIGVQDQIETDQSESETSSNIEISLYDIMVLEARDPKFNEWFNWYTEDDDTVSQVWEAGRLVRNSILEGARLPEMYTRTFNELLDARIESDDIIKSTCERTIDIDKLQPVNGASQSLGVRMSAILSITEIVMTLRGVAEHIVTKNKQIPKGDKTFSDDMYDKVGNHPYGDIARVIMYLDNLPDDDRVISVNVLSSIDTHESCDIQATIMTVSYLGTYICGGIISLIVTEYSSDDAVCIDFDQICSIGHVPTSNVEGSVILYSGIDFEYDLDFEYAVNLKGLQDIKSEGVIIPNSIVPSVFEEVCNTLMVNNDMLSGEVFHINTVNNMIGKDYGQLITLAAYLEYASERGLIIKLSRRHPSITTESPLKYDSIMVTDDNVFTMYCTTGSGRLITLDVREILKISVEIDSALVTIYELNVPIEYYNLCVSHYIVGLLQNNDKLGFVPSSVLKLMFDMAGTDNVNINGVHRALLSNGTIDMNDN